MNRITKIYPWIPIVGIFVSWNRGLKDYGFDKDWVWICSGILQGVYFFLLFVVIYEY